MKVTSSSVRHKKFPSLSKLKPLVPTASAPGVPRAGSRNELENVFHFHNEFVKAFSFPEISQTAAKSLRFFFSTGGAAAERSSAQIIGNFTCQCSIGSAFGNRDRSSISPQGKSRNCGCGVRRSRQRSFSAAFRSWDRLVPRAGFKRERLWKGIGEIHMLFQRS